MRSIIQDLTNGLPGVDIVFKDTFIFHLYALNIG